MIIRNDKGFECSLLYPNENFCPDDPTVLYVINETTEEGKVLCSKILNMYPNYDFVLDSGDNIIDIVEIPESDPRYIVLTL